MGEAFTLRLADCNIAVDALFSTTRGFCRDYLTDAPADFSIRITSPDIDYERQKSAREDEIEGIPVRYFSDEYLETLAVYRKIAEKMIDYDTILFHGSVIAVDGAGYLFTAKSGTGKSTHTRLWREQFGRRAVMVNDDKPLIKITGDGATVYGTPWDGKHRLSSNISVPLKAICILHRDRTDHIESVSKKDAWPMLLQQCYRPYTPTSVRKVLSLLDSLTDMTGLYSLGCTMEPSAAWTAYEGMNKVKGKD